MPSYVADAVRKAVLVQESLVVVRKADTPSTYRHLNESKCGKDCMLQHKTCLLQLAITDC